MAFNKKMITDVTLDNKRVFIRVDYNVPLNENGEVVDDTRIRASLPTLKLALESNPKLILASHLGRPKGKPDPKMSLKPVAPVLSALIGREVKFVDDCIGPKVENEVANLKPGEFLLLENLRFHPGEKGNDEAFSKSLANLCDVYINDAFGTAHRAHASVVGMTRFVKEKACGLLIKKETEFLIDALENPKRPFCLIMGGAKVADKIDVLKNLIPKVNQILIGGAMAYAFLKAKGHRIGKSKLDDHDVPLAEEILEVAKKHEVQLMLPTDHLISQEFSEKSPSQFTNGPDIDDDWMGLDIGYQTIETYKEIVKKARTVLWNGPLGVYEFSHSAQGTNRIASKLTDVKGVTIVAGGDVVAAVNKVGVADELSHVSTGGGASLELLQGIELLALAALDLK